MTIKPKGTDITIYSPFSIGNIVNVTNYGCAYFDWYVYSKEKLKEACPVQYGKGEYGFYMKPTCPKEWKIKTVLCDTNIVELPYSTSLHVVLVSRFRDTMAMQVYVYHKPFSKIYEVGEAKMPFVVVDKSRKTIDEFECDTI